MASIRDITANTILDENPTTVNIGQTLSKVRTKMEEQGLRTIPIMDGKKFVGILSYSDMMEKLRTDPSTTKVESLTHTPPSISADDNIVELASLRVNSGRRKFVLLDKHDHLLGVVGEDELVFGAMQADELQQATVADAMTNDPVTVSPETSHETARKLMRDKGISRLPVVENGELTGLLTSNHLLRAMIPREQMTDGDYKHVKESLSDIPVSELMEEQPARFTATDAHLADAVDAMRNSDRSELLVTENGTPTGILTLRDIIGHLASFEAYDGLHVQLTGPDVPEEKQAILDKVETAVRGRLGRVLERPESLELHVKKYEESGERHKYSVHVKLVSKEGVTTVKTHDWDLLNAVDEGLGRLESVLKKEKSRRRDTSREQEREAKYR